MGFTVMRTEFMRKSVLCLAWVLAGASLAAAAPGVPAGWKVIKSPQRLTRTASPTDRGGGGSCQLAVPPAMVVDAQADRTVGQTGNMKTPDGNLSVSIQEHPPGETLARAKEVAMMFNRDAKVKEDSPRRVWLTYTRAGPMIWDVLVAGNPVVCSAHFIINDDRLDDAANSIVPTVGPSK
jgi:hypothetical protein